MARLMMINDGGNGWLMVWFKEGAKECLWWWLVADLEGWWWKFSIGILVVIGGGKKDV